MIHYNQLLDPTAQVDMEERIAAIIFDHPEVTEEDCAILGRRILYEVLRQFNPSFFEDCVDNQPKKV